MVIVSKKITNRKTTFRISYSFKSPMSIWDTAIGSIVFWWMVITVNAPYLVLISKSNWKFNFFQRFL